MTATEKLREFAAKVHAYQPIVRKEFHNIALAGALMARHNLHNFEEAVAAECRIRAIRAEKAAS